jgi:hypothetical protein
MNVKILVFALIVITAGNLFPQEEKTEEKEAKNRISFSIDIIGTEVTYERVFTRYFSVLGQASYNLFFFLNRDNSYLADSLSAAGKVRWYPFGKVFYLDVGFGYSYGYSFNLEDSSEIIGNAVMEIITFGIWPALVNEDDYKGGTYARSQSEGGFLLEPGFGWNIRLGKGFILPMSLSVGIRFGERIGIIPYPRLGFGFTF